MLKNMTLVRWLGAQLTNATNDGMENRRLRVSRLCWASCPYPSKARTSAIQLMPEFCTLVSSYKAAHCSSAPVARLFAVSYTVA